MEGVWILHLLLCVAVNVLEPSFGDPLDGVNNNGLKFGDDFVYPDTDTYLQEIPNKRLSKFVRIGRGLSSFVRIGRGRQPDFYGLDETDDLRDDDFDSYAGESSAFDSQGLADQVKRLSSFVRIGRDHGDDFGETPSNELEKRGAFIRMGKFPSSALLRHRGGMIHSIARQPYYRRSGRIGQSSFIRIGKRDTTDALERMENTNNDAQTSTDEYRRYLRIGRGHGELPSDQAEGAYNKFENKRLSNFVRIGRGPAIQQDDLYRRYMGYDDLKDKRMSHFVRIGKSVPEADKRFSKFVRIGKGIQISNDDQLDKRMSQFVRIGKDSPLDSDTIDKRFSKFVRIGKDNQLDDTMDKRMSQFVRIGKGHPLEDNTFDKRFSKFVRIGKDGQLGDQAMDKRMSNFVRIGKDIEHLESGPDKRLSSFVRIGKSNENKEDVPDKRLSSFVRIGKNFNDPTDRLTELTDIDTTKDDKDNNNVDTLNDDNMIGMEKDEIPIEHPLKALDKRALSRFVRIGKSGNENVDPDINKRRMSSFVRIGRSASNKEEETKTESDINESK